MGWLKLPFKFLDKPSREFHDVTISASECSEEQDLEILT